MSFAAPCGVLATVDGCVRKRGVIVAARPFRSASGNQGDRADAVGVARDGAQLSVIQPCTRHGRLFAMVIE